MNEIRVECYAGYRADQRPQRFSLRGRMFQVELVEDQWYAPAAIYFRVRADDGNFYVLRHDEVQDAWTDRKSTRLNSSHGSISYAVFCLKKKKQLRDMLLDISQLKPRGCTSLHDIAAFFPLTIRLALQRQPTAHRLLVRQVQEEKSRKCS